MVLLCAICRTYADKKNNLSFFRIPKDEARRRRWNEVCGFNLKNTSRICQQHFDQSDFINAPGENKYPRLMPSAVPIVPPDAQIKKPFNLFRKLEVVIMEDLPDCPPSPKIAEERQKTQAERCAEHEHTICRDKLEIMDLKKKLQQLERELAHLKKEQRERTSLESCLNQLFTENQIKRLKNPNKKIHWNSNDISNAVNLRATGAAAYDYLFHNGFPLPCLSTLKSWAQKI